jgi:hypothetical protein
MILCLARSANEKKTLLFEIYVENKKILIVTFNQIKIESLSKLEKVLKFYPDNFTLSPTEQIVKIAIYIFEQSNNS